MKKWRNRNKTHITSKISNLKNKVFTFKKNIKSWIE